MKRRQFLVLVAGAIAGLPLVTHAQETIRRIGVLTNLRRGDAEIQQRLTVFAQELERLGWTVGRNLQIDTRLSNKGIAHVALALIGL